MLFNWKVSKTVTINSSEEQIWHLWQNVNTWPSWDSSLEWSKLEGEFVLGAKGVLKPKDWKESEFTITELSPKKSFSTTSCLPLTRMIFKHVLKTENGFVKIKHEAQVYGLLAPILYFVLRKKIIQGLEVAVNELKIIAEQK